MTQTSAGARSRGRTYTYATHRGTTDERGNYICKPTANVFMYKPIYADRQATVIRPYSQPNPEQANFQWDPYRLSPEPSHFGDWLRRYPAVRNIGSTGLTFLLGDPANPEFSDISMSPPWILYRAIDRAVAQSQDQPGWAAFLRGGVGKGAQLPKPTSVYLMQGALMSHGAKFYNPPKGFSPEDKTIVLELGISAGESLVAKLDQVNPAWDGVNPDYNAMMAHGDPIALDRGKFFGFYKAAAGDPRSATIAAAPQGPATSFNAPAATTQQGASDSDLKGHACYIDDMHTYPDGQMFQANLFAQFDAQIQTIVKRWDDILHFPTYAEQAALLADQFPPALIMYAFADRPDWITPDVHQRAVAATSVATPGAAPGWAPLGGQPGLPAAPPAQPVAPSPPVMQQPGIAAPQQTIPQQPGAQFATNAAQAPAAVQQQLGTNAATQQPGLLPVDPAGQPLLSAGNLQPALGAAPLQVVPTTPQAQFAPVPTGAPVRGTQQEVLPSQGFAAPPTGNGTAQPATGFPAAGIPVQPAAAPAALLQQQPALVPQSVPVAPAAVGNTPPAWSGAPGGTPPVTANPAASMAPEQVPTQAPAPAPPAITPPEGMTQPTQATGAQTAAQAMLAAAQAAKT